MNFPFSPLEPLSISIVTVAISVLARAGYSCTSEYSITRARPKEYHTTIPLKVLSISVEKGRPLQSIPYNIATGYCLVNFAYQNPPRENSNTLTPLRQFVLSNCFRKSFDTQLIQCLSPGIHPFSGFRYLSGSTTHLGDILVHFTHYH